MTVLSSKKVLQTKNTSDVDSITSLSLTHRALSDVSCLAEFKNLERLDLGFNNLTSLEGLESCVNLKWLSVVQNKLQSLKGIEGLVKLTVLNAGKNKLKSMNEVKSLVSLRALILNENEIGSICKLDMKELNTLVLSRNPISSIGEALFKLKSITKLSLSNCRLQTIDSSLKSCTELKELRLAHNEINTVPTEFALLVKLQNLDMGNNLISNWSDLKVLSSLINLRTLNLQGNPISEKDKILRKVKKLLPNLHTFNARPIDKSITNKVNDDKVDDSGNAGNQLILEDETEIDHSMRKKKSKKAHPLTESRDSDLTDAELGSKHKRKTQNEETANSAGNTDKHKKRLKLQQNEVNLTYNAETMNVNPDENNKKKGKHRKQQNNESMEDKKSREDIKVNEVNDLNVIDSAETPFTELFSKAPEILAETVKKPDLRPNQALDAVSGLVTKLSKRKKRRNHVVDPAALGVSTVEEIGLGGPSAWDAI